MDDTDPTAGIITVGDGRGFVIESARGRLVITAGHCLPSLPPCAMAIHSDERTYRALLGPLEGEPTATAACVFANPMADVAVIGPPDDQSLAYEELLAAAVPLSIAGTRQGALARLFSLDGRWFEGTVMNRAGMLRIDGLAQKIVTGMCGVPILDHNGSAIGVISKGDVDDNGEPSVSSPALVDQLPAWLLRAIRERRLRYEKQNAAPKLADERGSRPEPAAGAEHLSLVLDDETKAAIAELKRQVNVEQDRRSGPHRVR